MELKNLKDYYEKQTYYDYAKKRKPEETNLEKRLSELTFFVNIAVFSILLALLTYALIGPLSTVVAVPIAFVLALLIYLGCKKGIGKALKFLMK